MGKKKGGFTGHAKRVGNRVGDRARQFVADARGGTYDQTRLAQDVGGMVMDTVDFWGGLFGGSASPTVGVVNMSAPKNAYKGAGGIAKTVLIADPVAGDAVWPVPGNANGLAVLQLAPVNNPGAPVDLNLIAVDTVDEDGLELRVVMRTLGAAGVVAGEYFGNLYFESANFGAGQYFAAVIHATVT